MKIKTIPTGGLCNRMRAMASSISIAKKLHATLTILWNKYEGLEADFEDLFLPFSEGNIHIVNTTKWLYQVNYKIDYFKRYLIYKSLFSQTIFNYNIYAQSKDLTNKIRTKVKQPVLLISGSPMCNDYSKELVSLFKPQADIQKRIDNITAKFSEYTIGVHIRRTDNKASISASPLQVFIDIINKEIHTNNNAMFYIASDDSQVKEKLLKIFGKRIITNFEDTSRNSLNGMKFAVVDLFCLSKTQKIIGSISSSYSQLAADLGDINIEYAGK